MNVLTIVAHPSADSFNHALATAATNELISDGHHVWFHDLYEEQFPPTLPDDELDRDASVPEIVDTHCRELQMADAIVVIHPNWWGQPPAILKGWIDRVIRPGIAYEFIEGDSGEGIPKGLLSAEVAIVFNTANTPPLREQSVFGDPLETIWRNCIFGLCGVNRFVRRTFSVVVTSSDAQRTTWIKECRDVIRAEVHGRA